MFLSAALIPVEDVLQLWHYRAYWRDGRLVTTGRHAVSADNGHFELRGLEPGTHWVCVDSIETYQPRWGEGMGRCQKVEAPARGIQLDQHAVYGRHGQVGQRPDGEIGIHAVRGGDIVGDHTVTFATQGERVVLQHQAQSRETFARGALRAARFLAGKPPGMYAMSDVLAGG